MIVTVTSSMPSRTGGLVWFAFDVPACADLDAIYAELRSGGVVRGDRIDTAIHSGVRRVIRRTPCILGSAAVALITPLHTEIISEDGVML